MGRFLRPILWLALIAAFSVGSFLFVKNTYAVDPPPVVLNEFSVNGSEWVEIMNMTTSSIDLSGWVIVYNEMGPNNSTNTLSGILPPRGLLTFDIANLSDTGGVFTIYNGVTMIGGPVGYGTWPSPNNVSAPGVGESAILNRDASWSIDTTPSKGWFNDAVDYPCDVTSSSTPPTLSSIDACLWNEEGVDSNLGDFSDYTKVTDLYFDKSGKGQIFFEGTLNLTDQTVVSNIANLGQKMGLEEGSIAFDSEMAKAMGETGALLTIYNLDNYGYVDIPKIIVSDDEGNIITEDDEDYPIDTSTLEFDKGDLSFSVKHFTGFDTAPTVTEVAPVSSPTTDKNPEYTFYTDVVGTYLTGGGCGIVSGTTVIGNNTITLGAGPLATGTYSNCIVKVIDGAGNSTTLNISSFTIIEKEKTLQDLIDEAAPSSTITVPIGVHNECLTIDKPLTLTGASSTGSIIDMNGCSDDGIYIGVSNVTVSNLTIKSSGNFNSSANAIYASTEGIINNLILDNLTIINSESKNGIYLDGVATGKLINSNIQNVCSGVFVNNTNGFEISNNSIKYNGIRSECDKRTTGIDLYSSNNITIKNNTISDNDVGIEVLTNCSSIKIFGNKITGNSGSDWSDPYGVRNDGSVSIDAAMNWWGSGTGPYNATNNPEGEGNNVSDNVVFNPWFMDVNMTTLKGTTTEEGDFRSYTLTSDYNVTSSGYNLTIPESTTVTGSLSWDGTINPPTPTATPSNLPTQTGYITNAGVTIEVGFAGGKLTLSKAAKLTFPNQKDKRVGYTRSGEDFTEITTVCGENSQTWADVNLGAEGDCKINSGNDLVVWTKHFTKFSTFTLSQNSTGGGSGAPISRPVLGNIPVTVLGGNTVKTRNITLSFDVSGATMVAISENSNYAGASWETYVSSKTFILSEGYGSKVLYIKFRSNSGGETPTNVVVNYVAPETISPATETSTAQNIASTVEGFTFNFRIGLTEKQKQSIINLVNSGRSFSETDAKNYAWATGVSNWQQFVGKNPKNTVATITKRYVFNRYLGIGSTGEDVKVLQQILKDLGYFTYPSITGYYGVVTKEAVIKYQKAKGLAPYPGWVGPATRAALNAE